MLNHFRWRCLQAVPKYICRVEKQEQNEENAFQNFKIIAKMLFGSVWSNQSGRNVLLPNMLHWLDSKYAVCRICLPGHIQNTCCKICFVGYTQNTECAEYASLGVSKILCFIAFQELILAHREQNNDADVGH